MNRVQQFLRSRRGGTTRAAQALREPKAERDATQEGARGLQGRGGVDFSQVRLHSDADAARQADALGARAFATGYDIYFGAGQLAPHAPGGARLLTHELGHVSQQAQHGEAVQYQPKGEKAGIGAAPPEEDFVKDPDNWGAEDADVLFDKDDAALDGGDEKAVSALAAAQTQAVYVHVHGYASKEGSAEYNLNLSAHRAVAVKHLLDSLLPPGSKVYVFAHGESRHFGTADNNRRAGISLMGPVADVGFKPKLTLGMDTRLTPPTPPGGSSGTATGTGLGPGPDIDLGRGPIFPAGPTQVPPYLTPLPPLGTPRHLMDNAALLAPSALHGVSPSTTGNVVEQWDAAYRKYHALGIPDQLKLGPIDLGAGSLANKEVANSIQAYHERNNPTAIEKSNADVDATVIMSPNLLDLFSKKKDKKGGK